MDLKLGSDQFMDALTNALLAQPLDTHRTPAARVIGVRVGSERDRESPPSIEIDYLNVRTGQRQTMAIDDLASSMHAFDARTPEDLAGFLFSDLEEAVLSTP